MPTIIDFEHFKETGVKQPPVKTLIDKEAVVSKKPGIDDLAMVMDLSTDELFVELMTRMNRGESLREIPTHLLLEELISRLDFMGIICIQAVKFLDDIDSPNPDS